jgi:chromosome segregation ATPase
MNKPFNTMKTAMKNLLVVVSIPLAMAACNQKKIDQLTLENHELKTSNEALHIQAEDYLQTFNEIEANLEEIKTRENLINLKTSDDVENKIGARQAIVEDIRAINALMLENKEKIDALTSKLSGTNSHFKKMVARLNKRIQEQEEQIATMTASLEELNLENEDLTRNLAALNVTLDTLTNLASVQESIITEQMLTIEDQTTEMNKAYVAVGTLKELKEENVIVSEGGLLGLGKVERLSEQVDEAAFTQINIREVNEIALDAKKMEFVTTHPEGSYEIARNDEEKVEKLIITDPDQFWNASRYLVVRVN